MLCTTCCRVYEPSAREIAHAAVYGPEEFPSSGQCPRCKAIDREEYYLYLADKQQREKGERHG